MNYKLLLDTSDRFLCVGIAKNDNLIYKKSFEAWQRQSELLIPEIITAFNELNIKFSNIDEIIVGKGPGSYTGVRIALTVAKTIASVSNIKIKAISSLAILGTINDKFIGIINARSQRSYIGIYENGKCILDDQVLPNDQILVLIDKYKKNGFKIYGKTEHLNIQSDGVNILEGLLTFSKIWKYEDNVLALRPTYLKDAL